MCNDDTRVICVCCVKAAVYYRNPLRYRYISHRIDFFALTLEISRWRLNYRQVECEFRRFVKALVNTFTYPLCCVWLNMSLL